MDFLLEFAIDLLFELVLGIFDNGAEIILDPKRSKGVRTLVLIVAGVCILAFFPVVALVIWGGITLLSENTLCGIIFIGIGLLLLLAGLWRLGKGYKRARQKLQKNK